mmetsp:Transcript_27621/g.54179  ORF Transcript_27621/g.54179 Transcript_27621/m.54179 type:complete len:242 (+) Transcript_27621:275-1000(+)
MKEEQSAVWLRKLALDLFGLDVAMLTNAVRTTMLSLLQRPILLIPTVAVLRCSISGNCASAITADREVLATLSLFPNTPAMLPSQDSRRAVKGTRPSGLYVQGCCLYFRTILAAKLVFLATKVLFVLGPARCPTQYACFAVKVVLNISSNASRGRHACGTTTGTANRAVHTSRQGAAHSTVLATPLRLLIGPSFQAHLTCELFVFLVGFDRCYLESLAWACVMDCAARTNRALPQHCRVRL